MFHDTLSSIVPSKFEVEITNFQALLDHKNFRKFSISIMSAFKATRLFPNILALVVDGSRSGRACNSGSAMILGMRNSGGKEDKRIKAADRWQTCPSDPKRWSGVRGSTGRGRRDGEEGEAERISGKGRKRERRTIVIA